VGTHQLLRRLFFLVYFVVERAQLVPFVALPLVVGRRVRTLILFEESRVVNSFQQSVAKLTIQLVWALVPGAVFADIGALLWQVVEILRRSPEVLLSVGVIAVRPLVLLVDVRTESGLIEEHHERFYWAVTLEAVQFVREALFLQKSPD